MLAMLFLRKHTYLRLLARDLLMLETKLYYLWVFLSFFFPKKKLKKI